MKKKLSVLFALLTMSCLSMAFNPKLYYVETIYFDANGNEIGVSLVNECRNNSYYLSGTTNGAVSTRVYKERCNFDPGPVIQD